MSDENKIMNETSKVKINPNLTYSSEGKYCFECYEQYNSHFIVNSKDKTIKIVNIQTGKAWIDKGDLKSSRFRKKVAKNASAVVGVSTEVIEGMLNQIIFEIEKLVAESEEYFEKFGVIRYTNEKREEEDVVQITSNTLLHPAGGITDNFVYEPIGNLQYVYKTKDGAKGITNATEDEENWFIQIENQTYVFSDKPLDTITFYSPNREIIEKWINNEHTSKSGKELFNICKNYLRTFLDLPDDNYYSIAVLTALESWLREVINVVFYLGIVGGFGGGKTVAAEAITYLLYHGHSSGNISSADVARSIDQQKLSLFIDDIDSFAGSKDSEVYQVVRQGYRKGLPYSRVNPNTLEPEDFDIFGVKIFTIHSDIERALKTRTFIINIAESSSKQLPILNLKKEEFGKKIYDELFIWYMDNILELKDKINANDKFLFDLLNLFNFRSDELDKETVREYIYKSLPTNILEKVEQVQQVTGRNLELFFIGLFVADAVGLDLTKELISILSEKKESESEFDESVILSLLKDFLIEQYEQLKDKPEYLTPDGLFFIKNKELYTSFNAKLKGEGFSGITPHKFKGYLRDLGFVDKVNRKAREVMDKGKKQALLCCIFDARIKEKLGFVDDSVSGLMTQKTVSPESFVDISGKIINFLFVEKESKFVEWENWVLGNSDVVSSLEKRREIFWECVKKFEEEGRIYYPKEGYVVRKY